MKFCSLCKKQKEIKNLIDIDSYNWICKNPEECIDFRTDKKSKKVRNRNYPKCPACFFEAIRTREFGDLECEKCGTIFCVESEITYFTQIKKLGKNYNLPFSIMDRVTLKDGILLSSIHESIKCDEKKCWGIISNINFEYHTPLCKYPLS